MDEEFEFEFADELDALYDMDHDPPPGPDLKGRKSLNFSTPSTTHSRSRIEKSANTRTEGSSILNDSFPQPLEPSPQVVDERTSKKRGANMMFSNVSEDEEEKENVAEELPDIVHKSKRRRTNETNAAAAAAAAAAADIEEDAPPSPRPPSPPDEISRIKNRRTHTTLHTAINRMNTREERLFEKYDFEKPRVWSRIPMGDYVTVTREDGHRMYMKVKSKAQQEWEMKDVTQQQTLQLLTVPLMDLRMQLEDERGKRLLAEASRLSDVVNRDETSGREEKEELAEDGNVEGEREDHSLWVERYNPQRYTELLSDEATNRLLLKWLKLWDHLVFDKVKKTKEKNPAKEKKFTKDPKDQKPNSKFTPFVLPEDLDEHKRPFHKVALLSGPPGLGKTTLAHVIARHAGYNVVEMNASDDRSPDIFKQRIESATQMKAVLGADPRPNCLIIDEIDGAGQPAINMLLSLLKTEFGAQKKKKKDGGLLLRPIICICNDLYVPALRQLRQAALTIAFPPTIGSKLATRLGEITKKENLKTDLTTLLALCEKADNDIRSCLNTLQFVRGRAEKLDIQSVHSMSLGQKDAHRTLFSVWQHIFTMPRPKRKHYVNPHDRSAGVDPAELLATTIANNNTSLTSRFHNTLHMTQAAGEQDKVLQGLYENYLESKTKDTRMEGVQLALEWVTFVDQLSLQIGRTQNYILMPYTSYLPIAFHLLFASNQPQKIQYPRAQFEMQTKLNRSQNLLTTLMNEMVPSIRKNLNTVVIVTEVLPPLLCIIQPSLRPVNTQLYSSREKEDMAQLIRIMIAYNLTYIQQHTQEGQYTYTLDPDLDEVVRYPGIKVAKQLTYAAKQLIAREIDLERMRRSELSRRTVDRPLSEPAKMPDSTKADGADPTKPLPSYKRQNLEFKHVTIKEIKAPVDFFGRAVSKRAVNLKTEQKKEEIIGGDVWFRFKEGYSNAVRKTVRIQDLQ